MVTIYDNVQAWFSPALLTGFTDKLKYIMKNSEILLQNNSLRPNQALKAVTSLLAISMLLTGCETVLIYKDGGDSVQKANEIRYTGGSAQSAKAAYTSALKSNYPDIRSEAAFNLAQMARAEGNEKLYQTYMRQAATEGHAQAKVQMVDIYRKSGNMNSAEAESVYKAAAPESASANMSLMEMALKKKNTQEAATYAAATEKLIQGQIATSGDSQGSKSLMLARFYATYSRLLPAGTSYNRNPDYWYSQAINKGNVKAAPELAEYWLASRKDKDVHKDVFALMLQAAKAGDDDAVKYVAESYQTGRGVAQDVAQANYWYGKVKSPLSSGTYLEMGYDYLDKGDVKSALAKFEQAAKINSNSYESMFLLDAFAGKLTPAYMTAYKQKGLESLFGLAKKFKATRGAKYPKESEKMFELAAEAGSNKAAFYMAQNLDNGSGSGEANKWYKKAAEAGNPRAMVLLARRAKIGQGQNIDPVEAFKWFKKAAEAGVAEGQYEVGIAYANGTGVEKDPAQAKVWLEKAKAGGYALAVDVLNEKGKE